ncbi:MAG TPA: hypothetical protein GX503_04775, partial [Clostridiales bacterium]|nr:hypothetical protein [Clostridiales bacterium]
MIGHIIKSLGARIHMEPYENKLLFFYRYLSLFVPSVFYMFGNFDDSVKNKWIVVACLFISSTLLMYLYDKNQNSPGKIMMLILIETVGNSFILIPSGGLNSPYIWYALNTFLIASLKLGRKYFWLDLLLYIFVLAGIAFYLFYREENQFYDLLNRGINFIFSLIAVIAAIDLLERLIKKLEMERKNLTEANRLLRLANTQIKESMDHIVALYEAIHFFTNQRNKDNLIKMLLDYTKKITKTNLAFFAQDFDASKKGTLEGEGISERLKRELSDAILKNWNVLIPMGNVLLISLEDRKYMLAAMRSAEKIYGILGIESTGDESVFYTGKKEQLQFLSELGSTMLKRFDLEEMNERLLIEQERNRIADEIHDSTLQKLFSVSCGIFALAQNAKKMNREQLGKELNMIRNALENMMEELRRTIYSKSWKNSGKERLKDYVSQYLFAINHLNHINASFCMTGEEERLPVLQKKAFYRIICEGVGNA